VLQLTARIFTHSETNAVRDRLIKAATGTLGLKIVSTGLSFLISVFLARLLGAAGYGTYSYVLAWIALLGVPALLGLDRLLVRELAVYRTQSAWGQMMGLLSWANKMALMVSLGLAGLAAAVIWIFAGSLGFQLSIALWLGLLMLPLGTILSLKQGAIQGLNRVVVSLVPEFLIRPLALLSLLGCAYLLLQNGLNAQWALGLNAAALLIALATATYVLQKILPQSARDELPVHQSGLWLKSALAMVLISGMNVINHRTDTLMLGAMKGVEEVGIYAVANRGAQLILLIQTAVNSALGPTIAGLHAAGKIQRLQNVITRSAQGVLLVSSLIAFALVLIGDRFLALFGSEFIQAYSALSILSVGCVINAAAGSVGLLLVMTGYERDAAKVLGTSVVLNVVLNAALIPHWGVEGAATASSVSMIARNLLMVLVVHRRVGIHSTALGQPIIQAVKKRHDM
jgi:O-antigen/teichoic acid export membrane protein